MKLLLFAITLIIVFILITRFFQVHEDFYTFYIPQIIAPIDPYPRYITDEKLQTNLRFFPESASPKFWVWESDSKMPMVPRKWIHSLLKWFTSQVPVRPLRISGSVDFSEILNAVGTNSNQMAIVPSWMFYHYDTNGLIQKPVTAVMHLYSYRIYTVVQSELIKDPQLQLSKDVFAPDTVWGVGPKNSLSNFIAERLINTWYSIDDKKPIIINREWDDLLNAFKNKEIRGLLFCESPSVNIWNTIQEVLPKQTYVLIPVFIERQPILRKSVPMLQQAFIDLNDVNLGYLPTRVGTKLYWTWNPYLETVQFPVTWIAHPDYSADDIYYLLKSFFNDPRMYKSKYLQTSGWNRQNAFDFGWDVEIHKGAQMFMESIGLMSAQDNSSCVLYAGSRPCPYLNERETKPTPKPVQRPDELII